MLTLTTRHQVVIGMILLLMLVLTRGQHAASIDSLPAATLATFFLAGVYIASAWFLALLFTAAALVDYLAITVGDVNSFCFTPAYSLLIPAYGALWLAGRVYTTYYRYHWVTLIPLSISVFIGALISELLSSGGFYRFSGHFTDPTLVEFGERLVKYFPSSLSNMVFYIVIAMMIHSAFLVIRKMNHSSIEADLT